MANNKQTIIGFAAGVAAGVSYGLNPLFGKPLLDGGVPVLSMLFFRYSISVVILGIWMAFRHESFRVNGGELRLIVVLGCLFAASSVFLFESYRFIPTGLATTLVYLYPVFVALIMVVLRVYPKWQVWLSIVATLVGVVLLSWPSGGTAIHWLGIVLAALSALSYAIYLVIVNRSQRIRHVSEHVLTFYGLIVGAIAFLTYLLVDGTLILQGIDTMGKALNLLGLAIFPTMIAMLTIALSTRLIGPTKTSVLGALEPVTAIMVGTLVFDEPLTANIIAGIVICIAAVLFMIVSERH
ncbi:MAG: DMT family transporter [Paludibacteraceae bacterium]|nr:DMT family transporter [Paludibacteraceae bacterium]